MTTKKISDELLIEIEKRLSAAHYEALSQAHQGKVTSRGGWESYYKRQAEQHMEVLLKLWNEVDGAR